MLTLLLGGARSGKSMLATRMAARAERPVVFIGTAEGRDDEMRARIEAHRSERPDDWVTVEEPVELSRAIGGTASDAMLIVDCLTLWVANLMERGVEDITSVAAEAARVAASHAGGVIAVSNEVGSGIVPADAETRRFRDLLGSVNSIWADAADRCALVVAGRTLPLGDPSEPFDA